MHYSSISFLASIAFLFPFFSCQSNPTNHSELVGVLKNASQIASAEFDLEKIVIANQSKKLLHLIPLEGVSFIAKTEASLRTGIDFGKIQEEDVKIQGTSIALTLPPVEVVGFSYPSDKVHPIEEYTHLKALGNHLTNSDIDLVLQQAQLQLMESINHLHIRSISEDKVKSVVQNLLRLEGFEEVSILFKPTDKPLMFSQETTKPPKKASKKLLNELKEQLP